MLPIGRTTSDLTDEPLPLVLQVYWLPGEYLEVDQGEMQDWEAVALLERVSRLIEDNAEEEAEP